MPISMVGRFWDNDTDEDDDRLSKHASKPTWDGTLDTWPAFDVSLHASKPTWDGTLDTWPAFDVSLKSHARSMKLFSVMTKGVVDATTRRLDFNDSTTADLLSWWVYTGHQDEAEGPTQQRSWRE